MLAVIVMGLIIIIMTAAPADAMIGGRSGTTTYENL